jgi:hypothetical protein
VQDKEDTHVPFASFEGKKYWCDEQRGKAFFGSPLGEGRFGTFRYHQAYRAKGNHCYLLPTDFYDEPQDAGLGEFLLEQISIDTVSGLFLNSGRDVALLKVFPVDTLLPEQVSIADVINPAPTLEQELDRIFGPRRGVTGKHNIRGNTLPPKSMPPRYKRKRSPTPEGSWTLQDYNDGSLTTLQPDQDFKWDTEHDGRAIGKGSHRGLRMYRVPGASQLLRQPLRQPYTLEEVYLNASDDFLHDVAQNQEVQELIAYHNKMVQTAQTAQTDAYPFAQMPLADEQQQRHSTRLYHFLQYHNHLVQYYFSHQWPTHAVPTLEVADSRSSDSDSESSSDSDVNSD